MGLAVGVIAWMCFAAPLPAVAQAKNGARTKVATRVVVDGTGRRQRIPLEVHRIVSLASSLTEIIYALGAEDRLVGVSEQSDKPPAAKEKPDVGMSMNPSLEAIAGLKPDLVLMTAINRWQTEDALKEMGIPVYGIEPHAVEETLQSITHIGDLIDAQEQARDVVANLQQRLDALKTTLAGVPPKSALFVVWEDPLISVGNRAFIADALRCAGAASVVRSRLEWPQVSMEEIVKLEPDYIVFAKSGADTSEEIAADVRAQLKELREEPAWRNLRAVKEGHVAVVSDEVNLPAPGLIDAIEQLARQIHPEAFQEKPQTQNAATRSNSATNVSTMKPAGFCAGGIPCGR
ncbi:MAG TPA: ABC transporter substrate-binding protein [Candidatus Acidoferrales bacterium]|nr:ABC transporter substrate-binding protein [Candidatus Acidoferrales bacterium]